MKSRFGKKDVKILSRASCHDGFFKVDRILLQHRLFAGGWSAEFERELFIREPGIGILLYDPDLDKVALVSQFRIGCLERLKGPWPLELIAGIQESGESPQQVAIREAAEEAGCVLDPFSLIPVAQYYNSPGGSAERISIFCAGVNLKQVDSEAVHGNEDEHEDIRVIVLSREQALAAIAEGEIDNAMAIIALQWLQLNYREIFRGKDVR